MERMETLGKSVNRNILVDKFCNEGKERRILYTGGHKDKQDTKINGLRVWFILGV